LASSEEEARKSEGFERAVSPRPPTTESLSVKGETFIAFIPVIYIKNMYNFIY
jgi:hypothetical protein